MESALQRKADISCFSRLDLVWAGIVSQNTDKAQMRKVVLFLFLCLTSSGRSTKSENAPPATIMKPEERVDAYISDWYKCWLKQGNGSPPSLEVMSSIDFFTQWEHDIAKMDADHWTGSSGSSSSFSIPPKHDPDDEKIVGISANGDEAKVETKRSSQIPQFTEYSLVRDKETWKISSTVDFYDEEAVAPFTAGEVDSWLAKTALKPKLPPPEAVDSPNCELLFKEGHVFKGDTMRGAAAVEVRRVGKISLSSGAIIVRDFGYDPGDARPLSLAVEPGEYDVDVAVLEETIAAVRILLEPGGKGPFHYRRAVSVDGYNSVIGVDAGNVCFADARAYMSRTKRNHERDCDRWFRSTMRAGSSADAAFLMLDASIKPNAVVVRSGHGDGGYPAFWMLDASDKPVALVVDFLIAAEFPTVKTRIPWKVGFFGDLFDETKSGGIRVRISAEEGVVVSGASIKNICWLDREGKVVGDNSSVGSWSSGEERGWYVNLTKLADRAVEMEVECYSGYLNRP